MTIRYRSFFLPDIENVASLSFPTSIYIKLTSACMLNCSFCSQGRLLETSDVFQIEMLKSVLEDCAFNGTNNVIYTGGEPLLYPNIIDILRLGKKLRLNQSIVTNGILLDKLLGHDALKYISNVGISIHAWGEKHDEIVQKEGAFKRVLNNINSIKDKCNISINFTCSSISSVSDEIRKVAAFCRANNFGLLFNRINKVGRAAEETYDISMQEFITHLQLLQSMIENFKIGNCVTPCVLPRQLKYLGHGCDAGFASLAIEPTGDVKLCASAEFSLGNIKNYSIKEIWESKILKQFRSLIWLPVHCTSCTDVFRCFGGCKVESTHDMSKWPSFCDSNAMHYFSEIWNVLQGKIIYLNINKAKFEDTECKYILLTQPVKICNDVVYDMLKCIDGKKTGKEIIDKYQGNFRIEQLLVSLYRDGIISTS